MARDTALTAWAEQGYKASKDLSSAAGKGHPENPTAWSSAAWMAFELGHWLYDNGYVMPSSVTMSRGYTLNVHFGKQKTRFRWLDDSRIVKGRVFTTFEKVM